MTLMADLPELGSLDRKAVASLASLAGLAPHPNQSGTRTGKAHIGGGRPCVRAALYMAAVSAARTDKGFKREYLALRQAGKPAKVALVAIARMDRRRRKQHPQSQPALAEDRLTQHSRRDKPGDDEL